VPALVAIAFILAIASGPAAWLAAAAVALGALGTLGFLVCAPNSSFFTRTLSRAAGASSSVALTFDDGPDPLWTPRVLEILARKNVPAAFFVVGARARANAGLVGRIAESGHIVANHSDRHGLSFHFHLWSGARTEIAACNDAIRSATGKEPLLFRSPQGFKNPALGDVLRETGMTAIGWQVRGFDAIGSSASEIVRRVVRRARPGAVVLLHDGSGLGGTHDREPTLEALPQVIDALRAEGLSFVRLDTLLGVPAYR
jgi:peptidoglycan-N-acetylglucosamine deacetylase